MAEQTARHAPLPWKVITTPARGKRLSKGLAIQAENGWIFADFHEGHGATGDEANINYIVRACNSHDDLLKACKKMLDWGTHFANLLGPDVAPDGPYQIDAKSAREAIAKAEAPNA